MGPPLGKAREREADNAVQELRIANASPSIDSGEWWRRSSCFTPRAARCASSADDDMSAGGVGGLDVHGGCYRQEEANDAKDALPSRRLPPVAPRSRSPAGIVEENTQRCEGNRSYLTLSIPQLITCDISIIDGR